MTEADFRALGLLPAKPPAPPAQPPVDRTPRDVSWFKRGEECPH